MTIEELLANEAAQRSLRPLRVGETVEGTIAAVAGDEAEAGSDGLRVGEQVIAAVMQPEDLDGRVVLSLRRARNRSEWTQLEETRKSGSVIDGLVLEANRGGVGGRRRPARIRTLSQLASIGAIDVHEHGVGVTSYGLFVDVGVADGLVHRSEITWEKGIEPTHCIRSGRW